MVEAQHQKVEREAVNDQGLKGPGIIKVRMAKGVHWDGGWDGNFSGFFLGGFVLGGNPAILNHIC